VRIFWRRSMKKRRNSILDDGFGGSMLGDSSRAF
jgi:hypothetical protein